MDDFTNIYEKISKGELFQKLLSQIPNDEKPIVEKALRDLCEQFEEGMLKPVINMPEGDI
jgi:hypothetical protein